MSLMKYAAMAAVAMCAVSAMAQTSTTDNTMQNNSTMQGSDTVRDYQWGTPMNRQQLVMYMNNWVRPHDAWVLDRLLRRLPSNQEDLVLHAISNALNANRTTAMAMMPSYSVPSSWSTSSTVTTTDTTTANGGTATTTTTDQTTANSGQAMTNNGQNTGNNMNWNGRNQGMMGGDMLYQHFGDVEAFDLLCKDLNAHDRTNLRTMWPTLTSGQQDAILAVVKGSADMSTWRAWNYRYNDWH